jgi:uncharacterized membrane protein
MKKHQENVTGVVNITDNLPNPSIPKYPSRALALEEIRFQYFEEERRRSSLESKSGIFMGYVGIIITIISVFTSFQIQLLYPFYIFMAISFIFGIWVIKPTYYPSPHKEAEDFFGYAKKERETLLHQFLLNYVGVLPDCVKKTNQKGNYLIMSYLFAFVGILYIILISII